MKQAFAFTLEGKDWSRLYNWYWVPSLLLALLTLAGPQGDSKNPATLVGAMGVSLALSFLSMLVHSFFTVPILRTWLPHFSVNQKTFTFAGETNDYLVLNVKGFLLSLVTVGIYLPWWARNVLDYLARETSFDGASPRFTGNPGRLLVAFLVMIGLLIVITLVLSVGLALAIRGSVDQSQTMTSIATSFTGITFVLVVLVMAPTLYLMYAWMVQFSWQGTKLLWVSKLAPSTAVILGQLVLTILSLGIWFPGAFLTLYRYFVNQTQVQGESGETLVRFSFEGSDGEGFVYLWRQILLTIITVGFYGAWSGPHITRWLADRTFAEDQRTLGPAT